MAERAETTDGAAAARPAPAVAPRDAASLLLWRHGPAGLEVLMGRRSARHRFMPQRLVFPGGAVDRADRGADILTPLSEATRAALRRRAPPRLAQAIAVAAARELHEETGLLLGAAAPGGLRPDLAALDYLCRAVTPPGPVRFNARFLSAPAAAVSGALAGSGELEALGWVAVEAPPEHALAPITARVLEEFRAAMALDPAARALRPAIWFQGHERRRLER